MKRIHITDIEEARILQGAGLLRFYLVHGDEVAEEVAYANAMEYWWKGAQESSVNEDSFPYYVYLEE